MYNISYKAYTNKNLKNIHQMIDTSAWIWNHCVVLQKRYYSLYKKYINVNKLQKHVAKLRNKNPKWKILNSQSVQEICQRLDLAYKRFFKQLAKRPPKFKKARNFSSFVLKQSGWSIQDNILTINKIKFKFSKSRNYENIKRITIKRNKLGEVFFVLCCDTKSKSYKRAGNAAIGIDFGLKTYLTLSDGTQVTSPQFFKQYQNKLREANKELSRKKKNSKNRIKVLQHLQRVHLDIFYKRKNFHYELAHQLCKYNSFISIEDLNIESMKKLWGKKVSDLSFSSFVNILTEVALKYGTIVQKIDRYFPSSKLCTCGTLNKDLKLSDRQWYCKNCGEIHSRDLLASNNILSEGIRLYSTKHKTSILEAV